MANSASSLLYERLEAPLAPLPRLPRGLWLWSLVHSQGRLAPRLAGIEALRLALLDGRASSGGAWLTTRLAAGVATAIESLELPRHCREQPEFTDAVLRSLCFHLDLIVDYMDRGAAASAAEDQALQAFADEWQERCGMLDEIVNVLGESADFVKNARWDMLRGLLRSGAWQEVTRIRRLIAALPELATLIRGLGRARQTDEDDDSQRRDVVVMEEVIEPRPVQRVTRIPEYPGETRGIRRSGRIARMLPTEALLLLHPRLRLVWHARRAERTLLGYEDDERLTEWSRAPAPGLRPSSRRQQDKRLEMGPMLVCVDTSGSMQGGAEAVAKAVVLEAARTALAQRRACHVFAFSGPEEILEYRLSADADGIGRLAEFMGQSFRGGTDIAGPLQRALERLEERDWQLADLLIASDGEFGATPSVAADIRRAKEQRGLRIQGVLIGDRETIGFLEIADHIHWVHDWRRFGPGDHELPAHTRSLTASYFPGALRTPQNLAATVSGDEAARALASAPATKKDDAS